MGLVIILFAFTLSLVINFVERIINPGNEADAQSKSGNEQFAVEESESKI